MEKGEKRTSIDITPRYHHCRFRARWLAGCWLSLLPLLCPSPKLTPLLALDRDGAECDDGGSGGGDSGVSAGVAGTDSEDNGKFLGCGVRDKRS